MLKNSKANQSTRREFPKNFPKGYTPLRYFPSRRIFPYFSFAIIMAYETRDVSRVHAFNPPYCVFEHRVENEGRSDITRGEAQINRKREGGLNN